MSHFEKSTFFSLFLFLFFFVNHVIVILLLSGVFLQTFSHFQNQFSTTSITPLTAKSPFWDNDDHYLLTTYLFICSPRIAQPVPLMWNLPIWQDGVEIITMGTFLIRILWAPIFSTVFLAVQDIFFLSSLVHLGADVSITWHEGIPWFMLLWGMHFEKDCRQHLQSICIRGETKENNAGSRKVMGVTGSSTFGNL